MQHDYFALVSYCPEVKGIRYERSKACPSANQNHPSIVRPAVMKLFVYCENACRLNPQYFVAFLSVEQLSCEPARHRLPYPAYVQLKAPLLLRRRCDRVSPADYFAFAWDMKANRDKLTSLKVRNWAIIWSNIEDAKILLDYLDV